MELPWIENYAGKWQDGEGRTIVITTQNDENAKVDILLHGSPIIRPWCSDKPASRLLANYFPAEGPELNVDLGRPGFSLNLAYVFDDHKTPDNPEYLSVGVSRHQDDEEAKHYIKLFGKLESYKRAKV